MTGVSKPAPVHSKKTKVFSKKPGDDQVAATKKSVEEVKNKVNTMNLYSKEESDDEEMPAQEEAAAPEPTPAPVSQSKKKCKAVVSSDDEDEVLVPETQLSEKSEEKKKPVKKKVQELPKDQTKLDSVVVKSKPPTGSKIKKVRKVKKTITETDDEGFVVNKVVMVDEEYEVDADEPEPVKTILSKKGTGLKKQGGLGAFFGKA